MSTSYAQDLLPSLPISIAAWEKYARRGVTSSNIFGLSETKSASKITYIQFLTLRVICPELLDIRQGGKHFRARLCDEECYNVAKSYLEQDDEWNAYLDEIENCRPPVKPIGLYSMARYYQHAIIISGTKRQGLPPEAFNSADPNSNGPQSLTEPALKWIT